LSDTAVSSIDALDRPRHQRHEGGRGGRTAANAAANAASAGMGKKSNSTSQLSAAGNERRPPITPHHIICTQIAGQFFASFFRGKWQIFRVFFTGGIHCDELIPHSSSIYINTDTI
jgi:hypothetical protein